MNVKGIFRIIVVALAALSVAGVASAQDVEQGRPFRPPRPGPAVQAVRSAVAAVSEATGMSPRDVVVELAAGKTLTEVVTENGGDVAAVKAEMLAPFSERLAAAVDNGRITQERADELLATASARVDELFDRVFERLTQPGRPNRRVPNFI